MLYVKNLRKSYQSGNKSYSVLKGIDLSVASQEFVAVMGPSGSGKSTLLNCISCYIPFEEGEISLGGQNLKGLGEDALARIRNEKLGFVFQDVKTYLSRASSRTGWSRKPISLRTLS